MMDHTMITYDPLIRTLEEAKAILRETFSPILAFTMTFPPSALTIDHDKGLSYLRLPAEVLCASHIQNNKRARMVLYHRHPVQHYVREVEVTRTTVLHTMDERTITIYSAAPDLSVSVRFYMMTPYFRARL